MTANPHLLHDAKMQEGYQQFLADYFQNPNNTLFEELVSNGQKPKVMLVCCSDSRVSPSAIFNSLPGQFFVLRNVANLVPPCEPSLSFLQRLCQVFFPPKEDQGYHGASATLEHGVRNVGVEHIVLLGHTHCAGIRTLLSQQDNLAAQTFLGRCKLLWQYLTNADHSHDNIFIAKWLAMAKKAKQQVLTKYADQPQMQQEKMCGQETMRLSLQNLMSFDWIAERVNNNTLTLHAIQIDLENGTLEQLDPTTNQFVRLWQNEDSATADLAAATKQTQE